MRFVLEPSVVVIDKLDVRIPSRIRGQPVSHSREYVEICRTAREENIPLFRQIGHYHSTADLRRFGIPIILHTALGHGDKGDHKIEVLDAGQMSYARIIHEIGRVFNLDPESLEIMRIDLCADVPDIPVPWFNEHMRVKHKRNGRDFFEQKTSQIRKPEIQTIYYGVRPNLFRVYDKVAEWHAQYQQLQRRAKRNGTDVPAFEDTFQWPKKGRVLTRIERQLASDRIPEQIGRVGLLRTNLLAFNPFDQIEFRTSNVTQVPTPEQCGIEKWLAGCYLNFQIRQMGFQSFRSFVNKHGHRNGQRLLKKYQDFIPSSADLRISAGELQELFWRSTAKQFLTAVAA